MASATVVIAFYNKIDYLKLVLAGFDQQSFKDFEIIIADDGSKPEIVEELESIINQSSIKMLHIWQEDKGFRKNKILNEAVRSADSDYLIFIDGDCIPHTEFIREHFENRIKRTCLTGRRVNLSKKMTDSLTVEKVKEKFLEKDFSKLIIDGLFGKSFDVERGFYFRSDFFRRLFNRKKRGLLGCNFSLYKEDILSINGFDERYEAASIGEDTDIQFRLELDGQTIKPLVNIAVQYHLHHKLLPRARQNLVLFENVKKEGISYTPCGIIRQKPQN